MSPRRYRIWLRLSGAIAMAVVGYGAGTAVLSQERATAIAKQFGGGVVGGVQEVALVTLAWATSFALFGFVVGYLFTPTAVRPLTHVRDDLSDVAPQSLAGAALGMMIGLLLSALLTPALRSLPDPFSRYLPFGAAIVLGYLGAAIVGRNPGAYLSVVSRIVSGRTLDDASGQYILLDTSVIIDGRIADVAETGFIEKTLLVPRFILAELQQIADSSDGLRRNRGRRGLEILNRLQNSKAVRVEITDRDAVGTHEVDRKLVRLAQELHCPVMTNDYNLNRVAAIESVVALNLNELANAVKTILLPGEQLDIRIIQEGKEFGQGVGYLDDGTMVVVEGGREHVDETLDVTVTRVLQTVAGRMIFAQASSMNNAPTAAHAARS